MKLKKIALKAFIVLFVVIFLCMFSANMVQNITTAKVQTVQGRSGRFEDKIPLTAKIHFPETTEFVIEDAQKTAITVDKVFVKEGHWVDVGDTIFTAKLPSFDADMKKLRDEYSEKERALIELDIPNRKLSKESAQNDLYDAMFDAQDALSSAVFEARSLALKNDLLLPSDIAQWERVINLTPDLQDEAKTAIQRAMAAKLVYDDARTAFYNSFENKAIKIAADTFKYINDRNLIIRAQDELNEQIVELNKRYTDLSRVKATQAGYIVSLGVAANEPYDGIRAAYTMNKEGTLPVLRADLKGQTRTLEPGTRVEVPIDDWNTERTTVLETMLASDGTRYLIMALPESMAGEKSSSVRSIINSDGVEVSITYRAKTASTLLPASAVQGTENDYYVFVINQNYGGGFLGGNTMTVTKTPVTVIEKSDKYFSVAESFDWVNLATREDRPINDGDTVMNYVD